MTSLSIDQEEEDNEDDYGDEDNNDDEWFSDSSNSEDDEDNPKQEREPRLIMYAAFTQYDVVKEVGKMVFNYHLTKNEQKDWDIAWFDGAISLKLLQKMWPHQRTNHFPGMYNLARKNCLGRHLMRMQKWFPQEYDFFPQTFMCPTDYKEFKAQITAKRNKTFIVKPEASCQGKGIFLTRNFEDLDPNEHYVVQRYMHKPYLVDGYKFDLRIYVLLAGVDPLRVYIYKEGLARFATVPYESPTPQNLSNLFMHLTNYAINKDSENFVANNNENQDDVGSKRSFTSILKRITDDFGQEKCDEVFESMKDLIIKTLCIAQPYLQHLYQSCQPNDLENSMCCQILGFDIMLDHELKPQLLEVNQSPSFTTDSPLDYKIKKALITDTIKLWNLSIKRKLRTKGNKRAEMQQRLLKHNKLPINNQKTQKVEESKKEETISPTKDQDAKVQSIQNIQAQPIQQPRTVPKSPKQDKKQLKQQKQDEKDQQKRKKMLHREKVEKDLKGDYILMYPIVSYEEEFQILEKIKQKEEEEKIKNKVTEEDDHGINDIGKEYGANWQKQQKYLLFMDKAKQLWESFTQGKSMEKKKKEQEQKEQEEKQKKEQQKKKHQMWLKLKKQNEERKAKEDEERRRQYEMMLKYQEQYRQEQINNGDGDGQQQQMVMVTPGGNYYYPQQNNIDNKYMFLEQKAYSYMDNNMNHLPYKNPQNSNYQGNAGIFSSRNILGQEAIQQKVVPQQLLEFQQPQQLSAKTTLKEKLNQDYQNKSLISDQRLQSQGDTKNKPLQNGHFYLPEVGKQSFQIKKQIHDEYNEKTTRFAQLMKLYEKGMSSTDHDTSLPAVPALTFDNKKMDLQSDQISTHSNSTNYQKPPLNNLQLQKRLNDSRSSSRLQQKKQSIPINTQNIPLNNNQLPQNKRLNELLQLNNNTNIPSFTQSNQVYTVQQQINQQNITQNVTTGKINGINHYNIQPTQEIVRSMSMDRKDLPNIPLQNNSKANNLIQKQSQIILQDQMNENLKQKQHHNKQQKSEVLSDSNFSLGVVGERKAIINTQQQALNSLEEMGFNNQHKKSRLLKIKDKPRIAQNKPTTLNGLSIGYISANELYKLTH